MTPRLYKHAPKVNFGSLNKSPVSLMQNYLKSYHMESQCVRFTVRINSSQMFRKAEKQWEIQTFLTWQNSMKI